MPTQVGKLTASVTAEALVLAKSRLNKQDYQAANLAASWWVAPYKARNVQEAVVVGDNVVRVQEKGLRLLRLMQSLARVERRLGSSLRDQQIPKNNLVMRL